MDMKLRPFDFAQAAARAGLAVNGQPLSVKPAATAGASFGDAMAQALKGVSAQQNEAARLQREEADRAARQARPLPGRL